MPLALLPLIAETLPDPSSSSSVGWLLVGLAALVGIGNQFMGALVNFRKIRAPEPGNPAESDRIKALEAEIKALEIRMERRIGEVMGSINTRLQSLESTISHLVSDFSRALGVLEGKADAQAKASERSNG